MLRAKQRGRSVGCACFPEAVGKNGVCSIACISLLLDTELNEICAEGNGCLINEERQIEAPFVDHSGWLDAPMHNIFTH